MIVALIGISIPVFWLGEVVNLISQSRLHDTFLFSWVPPLGYTPCTQDPVLWFEGLVLPWITLSVLYIGFYARVLRASLLEIQNEDYIRTARAKGLTERRVLLRHTLRNSMITYVSLFGLDFGVLVGGGVLLVEIVFGIHGLGYLTYQSLPNLDLPVIMATVIYGAFFIVLASALVDVAYAGSTPECGSPDGHRATAGGARPQGVLPHRGRLVRAVDGVSFACPRRDAGHRRRVGSGKSVTMMSVMRLIIDPNARFEGEVLYKGRNLMALTRPSCARSAAREIAMIFQDPMTSLNPVYRVGWQICEQIRAHEQVSSAGRASRAIELLAAVGIPQPPSGSTTTRTSSPAACASG